MQKTIREIREHYNQTKTRDLADFIDAYCTDGRKGVTALVARAERRLDRRAKRWAHLEKLYQFDLDHCPTGSVVGIDEAGRGPLAGPVVAAACVIAPHRELLGLDDSKMLSESERERLYRVIVKRASAYGIGIVDNATIDQINILNATKMAMLQALKQCAGHYQMILTDYVQLADVTAPLRPIVKGDANSLAIAAASVLAKVTRDRLLIDYDRHYPQYGFAKHKGYGTAEHIASLRRYGACPLHRQSFIANLLAETGQ